MFDSLNNAVNAQWPATEFRLTTDCAGPPLMLLPIMVAVPGAIHRAPEAAAPQTLVPADRAFKSAPHRALAIVSAAAMAVRLAVSSTSNQLQEENVTVLVTKRPMPGSGAQNGVNNATDCAFAIVPGNPIVDASISPRIPMRRNMRASSKLSKLF
ncbi:MAG: hypothetical protein ACXWKC_20660 [Xanthobacteraceae bacterium]